MHKYQAFYLICRIQGLQIGVCKHKGVCEEEWKEKGKVKERGRGGREREQEGG